MYHQGGQAASPLARGIDHRSEDDTCAHQTAENDDDRLGERPSGRWAKGADDRPRERSSRDVDKHVDCSQVRFDHQPLANVS